MFSNQSFTHPERGSGSLGERFGASLRLLSLLAISLTAAATPWFLGGAIPHARLVLQCGAIAASGLAFFAILIDWKPQITFPWISLPLLGLAGIGAVQLQPRFPHVATQMNHAVIKDSSSFLPAELHTTNHPQTASPAETRRNVSQLISLTLAVFAVHECVRSIGHLVLVLSVLTCSGISMAALSLSQQFGSVNAVVGNHWKISNTTPFGCFVNPNNAAAWLVICLSSCLFLCGVASYRAVDASASLRGAQKWATWKDRLWIKWIDFVGKVSSMSSIQIVTVCGSILLMAAIAATLSRAGIAAACLGLTAFALSRFRSGSWITTLIIVAVIIVLTAGFLVLFELDTVVLSELQTLKDPVSESTGRLLHWSDSLRSCLDFPLLGSGLGAYRFATLPYQQHYTGKWFQRADNQYVELIVEAGWMGVACLVIFVILALRSILRPLKSDKSRRKTRSLSIRRWLSGAAACSLAAISGAAFFDYGISLPSVSAALLLIFACLLATESSDFQSTTEDAPKAVITPAYSRWLATPRLIIWLGVTIISGTLLSDTWSAVQAFQPIPAVERQLSRPDMTTLLESGDDWLRDLESFATTQRDDPEYQRLHALFLKLIYERDLVEQVASLQKSPLTPQQKNNLLNSVSPTALLFRLQSSDITPALKQQSLDDLRAQLKRHDWLHASRTALQKHPLLLSLSHNVCLYGLLLDDPAAVKMGMDLSRFIEPHTSPNLFSLGYFLHEADRKADGMNLWRQSLIASDTTRASILLEITRRDGVTAALKEFAPETWESAARAGLQCRSNPELQKALFELADTCWPNEQSSISPSQVQLRVSQLEAMKKPDRAVTYLNEHLSKAPRDVDRRKILAQVLENMGLNEKAYNEWLRIESFSGKTPETSKHLERLIQLPPTTKN